MKLNGPSFLNLSDSIIRKIMKAFNYFYYVNGKFPINNNLSSAPEGKTPDPVEFENDEKCKKFGQGQWRQWQQHEKYK